MLEIASFSDEDFRRTILRALRLVAVLTVLTLPLIWWQMGWRSGVLLLVGAAVSASGLWEWLQLLTGLMKRLDGGGKASPLGLVLLGFFVRLGVVVGVLYGSLKLLDGSVAALAVGLGLGVFALTIEGLRLVKAWTV